MPKRQRGPDILSVAGFVIVAASILALVQVLRVHPEIYRYKIRTKVHFELGSLFHSTSFRPSPVEATLADVPELAAAPTETLLAAAEQALRAEELLASAAEPPAQAPESHAYTAAPPGGGFEQAADAVESPPPPTAAPPRPGVLHFLFMVDHTLYHLPVWQEFFAAAPAGTVTVWMHCVDLPACKSKNLDTAISGLQFVTTVKSTRCLDLVSPQAWLAKAALRYKAPAGAVEKFVLLSDTTLPIKPFSFVYRQLVESDESDFCLQTPARWRKSKIEGVPVLLVKHSQWVVLNRRNTRTFVKEWRPVDEGEVWSLPLKGKRFPDRAERVFVPRKNNRCADEFAVFATCFGLLITGPHGEDVCQLNRTRSCKSAESLMRESRCRTLNFFRFGNPVLQQIVNDPQAKVHNKGGGHPIEMQEVGEASLAALWASPNHFCRKFSAKADLDALWVAKLRSSNEEDPLPALSDLLQAQAAEPKGQRRQGSADPEAREQPAPPTLAPSLPAAVAQSGAAPPKPGVARKGVLHFMLLVGDILPHAELWGRFLRDARAADWRGWFYCISPQVCAERGLAGQLAGFEPVRSVRTKPCLDVVTAEVELLKAALKAGSRPGTPEKFVLLSGSSLPIKPFYEVHQALLAAPRESDLCLMPHSTWRASKVDGGRLFLVRHSQWFVLGRDDALVLASEWRPVSQKNEWSFLLDKRSEASQRVYVTPGKKQDRCADEYAVFATLFSLFRPGQYSHHRCPLGGSAGCPSPEDLMSHSRCRVFGARGSKDGGLLDRISDDGGSKVHKVKDHALQIERLSADSLSALRASPFLFAERFAAGAQLDGFPEAVFGS